MKKGIHPPYDYVVFRDISAPADSPEREFLTRSTGAVNATFTTRWRDGKTYPVLEVQISAASHPFYTGTQKVLDTAGRVERFNRRYGRGEEGTP